MHLERLVHKTFCATERHRAARDAVQGKIWDCCKLLLAYRRNPDERRAKWLSTRFDTIFTAKTGHVNLDRLLSRLAANKAELLRVLEYPETPLHSNSAERDIRSHVTRRKLSAGTRSDPGRNARDACLGVQKTCAKLGVSFADYLGDRFGVAGAPPVPRLADLIARRANT